MADPVTNKVNFIYENNKNLQIEVPSSQQIRETPIGVASEENTAEIEKPINDTVENVVVNMTQVTGDKAEFSSDASVFVPVLTVTKEEAVYTTSKGDTKLQKVSIKEKLSEVDTESIKKMEVVANPFYSEVVSVVIPGPHELRDATLDRGVSEVPKAKESSNNILDGDQKSEETKVRTKIPVLKFKQMVDKVKQEKKKEATPSPRQNPRRSSIPRLKKSRRDSASAEKDDAKQKAEVIVKEPNTLADERIRRDKLPGETDDAKQKTIVIVSEPNIEANETMHIDIPPEDEFNKLFADIINNGTQETIVISPIEDPEKLENKFEEIVHDYEENKIQPINVEKIKYSKIPLLKRTSEIEVNVPKNLLAPTPTSDERDKKSLNKEFPQSSDETKKLKSDEDNNTGKSKEIVENKRKGSIIAEITIPVPIRQASKLTDDQEKDTNKQIIFAETKIPVRKRLSEQDIHAPTRRKSSTKDSILLSDCNAKNTIENKDNLQNTEIKSENEVDRQFKNKDTVMRTEEPLSLQECELLGEPKKEYVDKGRPNMMNKVKEETEKKKKPLLRRESDRNIQKLQDINRSTLKKSISVDESNVKNDFPTKETAINVKDKPQQEIEDEIVKPNKLKDNEQENNPTAPKRELLKELKDINEQDERKLPQETKEIYKTYEKKVPKQGSDDEIQNDELITKPELRKSFSVGVNRQKLDNTNTEINHSIKSIDNNKQLLIVDVGQFTKETENERVILINEITLPTSIRNVPKEIEDKYTNINEEIHNISSKEQVGTTDNKIKKPKVPPTDRGVHHIQAPREIIRLDIERKNPTDKNSTGDITHSRHMDQKSNDAVNIKMETEIAENTKTTVEDDEKSTINSVKNEVALPVPIRKSCKESEVGEKLSDDKLKLPNIEDDKMTMANIVRDVNVTILKPDVIELDANVKYVPEEESKDNIKIDEPFGEMSLLHKKTTSVDKINEENIRIVTENTFEGTVSQDSIRRNKYTIPEDDNLKKKNLNDGDPKLVQEKVIPNLNINYTPGPQVTPHSRFEQTALTTTSKNNKRNNIQSKTTDLILSPTIQDKFESDNYWQKKSPNKHIEVISPQKEKGTIYRAFNRIDNEENIKKEANNTPIRDTSEYTKEISKSKEKNVLKNNNKNIETVTDLHKEEFIEDPPILKGKVSRLISRLHSVEPRPDTHSKEFVKEIPKDRSVLSKIAMFERQESNDTIPNAEIMPQQDKKLKHAIPKIVEVVLKTPPERRRSSLNDTGLKVDISKAKNEGQTQKNTEPSSAGSKINEKVVLPNDYRHEAVLYEKEYDKSKTEHVKDQNLLAIQADTGKVLNDSERNKTLHKDEATVKIKSNENRPLRKTNKVEVAKSNKELSRTYHEEFKSDEDSNLKRVKSLAELDLGNAVKGKVRDMIMRINSIDVLEEKKEVISIKERPRKKSVSTIIALFESKLTPVQYEALKKTNTHASYKSKVVANQKPNMTATEVYAARLAELSTASLTYGKMDNVSSVKLSNGVEMPVLALGTALVEDVLGEGKIESINVQHKNGDSSAELEPRMLFHIIKTAIEIGYRAIDTAFIYGNQKEVGEAIRAKIDDGTVLREDLFISNKLWSTFHRPDLVEKACRDSLEIMGLGYFDLYMIHNPMSFKEDGDAVPMKDGVVEESEYDYMDAWPMMEELVPLGLARSIGVSNFNVSQVARVLKGAKIPPVVNQVECHPYLAEDALHDYCAQHNVQLNCFGVLGSKGTPANLKSHTSPVIDDPLVKVLASGLNMTPAQLLIRYQLERGHTATVKASTGSHLWENLQAVKLSLSSTEVNALHGLNRNKRTFTYKGMGDTHKNYPFLESV